MFIIWQTECTTSQKEQKDDKRFKIVNDTLQCVM